MRQVLWSRQLAPHAVVVAPVAVVTHKDNLGFVREEFVIGSGVDGVFSRIGQELRGIASGARFQSFRVQAFWIT